jgi:hypothetical protein
MRNVAALSLLLLLAACGLTGPLVVQEMDPETSVTVTRGTVPLVLYRDDSSRAAHARDFVYVGPLGVNRMGDYQYFLWLGIWGSLEDQAMSGKRDGFDSVVLFADGEPMRLELAGWTHSAVGVSRPVYNKPTATAADAYYPVTFDQIRLLAEATDIRLQTSAGRSVSYEPWDSQATAKSGMKQFVQHENF